MKDSGHGVYGLWNVRLNNSSLPFTVRGEDPQYVQITDYVDDPLLNG